jgi:UDP-glucose 4-epimerase
MNMINKNKKVLIIGGSGFLGSNISKILLKRNYIVTIFDKKRSKYLDKKNKVIISNLKNKEKLTRAIKNSDIVYHFAGIADIGDAMQNPLKTCEINIMSTISILDLCVKYKIKRFVFASSIYVHSDQGGFYRISKQASELFIEEFNKRYSLNYTILRFGTVYGPKADKRNNLTKIVSDALKYKKLNYSGGTSKAIRRYIEVSDAAKASCEILNKKYENKNILITGKKNIKITKIMDLLSKILEIKSKPTYQKITKYGHYNVTPYTYIKRPELKFYPKESVTIKEGLISIIKELSIN